MDLLKCTKGSDKKCTDINAAYCCARVELQEKAPSTDSLGTTVYGLMTLAGAWPKETGAANAVWACTTKPLLDEAVKTGYMLPEAGVGKNKVKAYCDNATALGASFVALATIFSASTF